MTLPLSAVTGIGHLGSVSITLNSAIQYATALWYRSPVGLELTGRQSRKLPYLGKYSYTDSRTDCLRVKILYAFSNTALSTMLCEEKILVFSHRLHYFTFAPAKHAKLYNSCAFFLLKNYVYPFIESSKNFFGI